MKLVPIKNRGKLEACGIFFSPKTLRRWHSQGIISEIFIKIGNRLFINLDKWENLIAQKAAESAQKAEKIEKLKGEADVL